jgi:hypothetical protein
VRNEEAEVADAAGAEALAKKLGKTEVAAPAAGHMPASPFSQAVEQQPQPQPQQQQQQEQDHVPVKWTMSAFGSKTSASTGNDLLSESLPAGGGDITGTEAATAREAAMMLEFERSSSLSGHAETASFKSKAEKELPPLCAPLSFDVFCLAPPSGVWVCGQSASQEAGIMPCKGSHCETSCRSTQAVLHMFGDGNVGLHCSNLNMRA